jgi:hypothetical protein
VSNENRPESAERRAVLADGPIDRTPVADLPLDATPLCERRAPAHYGCVVVER